MGAGPFAARRVVGRFACVYICLCLAAVLKSAQAPGSSSFSTISPYAVSGILSVFNLRGMDFSANHVLTFYTQFSGVVVLKSSHASHFLRGNVSFIVLMETISHSPMMLVLLI